MSAETIGSDSTGKAGPVPGQARLRWSALPGRAGSRGAPPADLGYELLPLLNDALRFLDVLAVATAGLLSWWALEGGFTGPRAGAFAHALLVGILLAPFVLLRSSEIRPFGGKAVWEPCRDAVLNATVLFGLLIVIGFLADASIRETRPLIVLWFGLSVASLAGLRLGLTWYVTRLERRGLLCEHVAIVGAGPLADRLIQHLRETRGASIDIVGIFDDRSTRLAEGSARPEGRLDDLLALGRSRRIDRVIVTLPWSAEERILQIMRRLKALSVDVLLCPDRIGFSLPRRQIDSVAGLPLLCLADRPMRRWAYVVKLLEDRVLASLLLLVFSPVMLAVALAVRLDSPGPIFFRQRRTGFNNSEIEVLKFRTMRQEATDALGCRQASRADDRVTRVGRILRRTSLDELPQLINVVRGDMSLIGPRPHPIGMLTGDQLCHEIVEDYAHRHRVKPGMTGWAQVNGYRGATETPAQLQNRVSYDLYYIDNWSLWFDLKILLMTFLNVVSGENRY